MYSFDQAFQKSVSYFDGDELAAKVWIDKYALRNENGDLLEDSPEMMHIRLAKEFERIEKSKFKSPYSFDLIFNKFNKFKYIVPQGSPMYGIGNNYQIISLSNCYVLDQPLDSYSSILDVDKQLVNISKRRGGVGIDLDNLRPEGTATKNAARTSTGIVSFMERYSNSIREVGQAGRRGALMLTLSVHHPDILKFCTIKNDNTKVTGANISVKLTKEFLDAVKKDKDYELRWPINSESPKIVKKISAREVWDVIINSAWTRAEPGLLMWDNVLSNGPADIYERYRSISTNPCAEISLCPMDSCRLICMNLLSYVLNPFTKNAEFDYSLFKNDVIVAQRLMDDLVDLEAEKINQIINKIKSDPEPNDVKSDELEMWKKILKYNNDGRRTGLGITALGDTFAALGLKYGSNESIKTTGDIYKTLKLGAYESSMEMAKELGTFSDWNSDLEKDHPFFKRIKKDDEELYNNLMKYGRRNVALLTTAPTGSVSIETQTTSGIEPLFMIGYKRRKKINPNDKNVRVDFVDQNGDSWQEFMVYHPTVKKWMDTTGETDVSKSPWYGCCAEEIDWINRVKLQAEAQKHVCHAISSTINLPEDISKEKVAEIYQTAFESGLKGITLYRKNCRSGVLVEADHTKKEKIIRTVAPKRPKEIPCDIYHVKVTKKLDKLRTFDYMVLIGLFNNEPYEIFAIENGVYDKKYTAGKIIKKSKGHYDLIFDNSDMVVENITKNTTETEDALTRMISTSLRHGADVQFIAEQLNKVEGAELLGFSKSISRALKRYIKDGSKSSDKCSCGGEFVYQEGCQVCKLCGHSKCG